jgi:histidyl-tRNA synthetase
VSNKPKPAAQPLRVLLIDEDPVRLQQLVEALQDASCEVAATAQKFGKQIRYAERRGIPYVWFTRADGTHQVKDIRSGDQVAADPGAWTPDPNDLRPQVITKEKEEL